MMIKVFSASKLVNHLSSTVIGSNSQFFSHSLKVRVLLICSPEFNSYFSSSSNRNVFEISFGSSLSTLDRTILQWTVVILSDKLECLEIIRGEITQCSASDSDSVNGVTFGGTVEVFSQWWSDQWSFISKEVLLNWIINSLVVFIWAHSSIGLLLSIVDFFLNFFRNLVEISSSIGIWNLTVLSSIVIRVVKFLVTAVEVINIGSGQTDNL